MHRCTHSFGENFPSVCYSVGIRSHVEFELRLRAKTFVVLISRIHVVCLEIYLFQ